MLMSPKVIRDPLYNYISIERPKDNWLIDLIDCPELQRLRRIHQLGVSDYTYPGANHSRLSHTLGVMHLMQKVHQRVEMIDRTNAACRKSLIAAAVLHDVGHGPFSHVFETCFSEKHEMWSMRVIRNTTGTVNKILTDNGIDPDEVAQLIDEESDSPQLLKNLLSSQLDVDRMDFLRRDSFFTGSGYGHFDWYRLINTFDFYVYSDGQREIVWPQKAINGIEEYIFSRYYMYHNVYFHKTTRGFERILEMMWKLAKQLRDQGESVDLVPAIDEYWKAKEPTVEQYLAIEEFTVLQQIQQWQEHSNPCLQDLAKRFMSRDCFSMIEMRETTRDFTGDDRAELEEGLKDVVRNGGYEKPEYYCLADRLKGKYNQPYFPEKESDEQSAKNAIRVAVSGESQPVEISQLLPRLKPITTEVQDRYRYYVPSDVRDRAQQLLTGWNER